VPDRPASYETSPVGLFYSNANTTIYLDLPSRKRMFLVTGLNTDVKQTDVLQFFDKLAGRVFCHWVDEQTVVVEFANEVQESVVQQHVRHQNTQLNRAFAVAPIENFDKIVEHQHAELKLARGKKRRFSDITPDSPVAAYLPSSAATASSDGPSAKRRKEKEHKESTTAKSSFPDVPFKDCRIL